MSGGRPQDWEGAGGGLADAVASLLVDLGYRNAHARPVSAALCPEPLVVTALAWERESAQVGEARWRARVDVLACCDDPTDAEATCAGAGRDLAGADWSARGRAWGLRVAAVETGPPTSRGRDRSGRWLWGLELQVTTVAVP